MNLISKKSFVLGSFLFLISCAGQDFSSAERLPDESGSEPAISESEELNATSTEATEDEAIITAASKESSLEILKTYDYVDPKRQINTQALSEALLYYHNNSAKIRNKRYLSIIDFSKRSTDARFFIINMESGEVWAIHTAHGKGSDSDHDGYAEKFSNKSGSNASSLGYYLAAETYYGKHGLSLKLDGLSTTNSKARARAVVIHGASYVKEAKVIQGRSWGCPAVAMNLRDKVINTLKGDSLIYAFAK